MATRAGLLGSSALGNNGEVSYPYKVEADNQASVTITLCNGSSKVRKVRAGYSLDGVSGPTAARWLLGGAAGRSLPPGESVQITTMLGPGQAVAGSTDASVEASDVSLTVNGREEPLA